MLVLSRKPGEAIRIGDDIEISVIEVRGDTVRIGINAPRNVPVFRMELLAEVAKTNLESVKAPPKPWTFKTLLRRGGRFKRRRPEMKDIPALLIRICGFSANPSPGWQPAEAVC